MENDPGQHWLVPNPKKLTAEARKVYDRRAMDGMFLPDGTKVVVRKASGIYTPRSVFESYRIYLGDQPGDPVIHTQATHDIDARYISQVHMHRGMDETREVWTPKEPMPDWAIEALNKFKVYSESQSQLDQIYRQLGSLQLAETVLEASGQ